MTPIAYVLADFPVLSETFVGNEIRAMEALGHRVVPIVMRRREGPAQPEDRALADRSRLLAHLPRWPEPFACGREGLTRALAFVRRQRALPRRSLIYQAARIARVLRAEGIGHVHAHFAGGAAAHAIVAARMAGVGCSFVCHGHDVYAEPEDLAAKLRAADLAVAVCGDLAADLARIAPGARIATVACGIDPERFCYLPRPKPARRLLFVGRLVEQKGLDDLLAARSLRPPAPRLPLERVGDGPRRPALEAAIARLGLKQAPIRFLGAKPADWFVVNGAAYLGLVAPFKEASDGARDTGPLVVKEAMALGLPVISTAFMGVKETLTTETGWLVPPGDTLRLAEAIKALAGQTPEARLRMLDAARERVVANFSQVHCAARLSAAFQGSA